MSCGQIALERAEIKVESYYASEIDKYAINIAQKNYPNTIQLGNINDWEQWKLPKIDLLIGGSPCQGFSSSGKKLNFDDPRSRLFFKYVEVLNHYKPKYFLFENVDMKKEWRDIISSYLKVEPIKINSTLVSAQNRERLYWTNIPGIEQPEDKQIYLKDVLESEGIVGRVVGRRLKDGKRADYDYSIKPIQRFEPRFDGKSGTLTTVLKDNMVAIYQIPRGYNKGGLHIEKSPTLSSHSWEQNNFYITKEGYRKLTPTEFERLQTVPEGYTEGVSDTQKYKMLGNGWTVDVIAHIFSYLK